jgi:hypothetical protein
MEATIISYNQKEVENEKPYIVYNIRCKMDGVEWTISKRYNDFYQLQKTLLKTTTPNVHKELASFPGKMMFGNKKSEKLERRKFNLQVWLDTVLTNSETSESRDVHFFLETKKHVGYLPTRTSKDKHSSTTDTSVTAVTTKAHASAKIQEFVKALYSYKRNDECEISFEKGDILLVLQKDESGWWYGRVHSQANESKSTGSNELNGFFPMNFAAPLTDEEEEVVNTSNQKVVKKRVLYYYQADPESLKTSMKELTIKSGEIVTILSSDSKNNGWCYVQREENGVVEEGWVPENYLSSENV